MFLTHLRIESSVTRGPEIAECGSVSGAVKYVESHTEGTGCTNYLQFSLDAQLLINGNDFALF